MLTVFAATFVLFLLIVGGMSLGYVFKRKSLQGSCGGITALGMEKVCDCRNLAMRAKARSQSGTAARAAGQAPHSVAIAKPGFGRVFIEPCRKAYESLAGAINNGVNFQGVTDKTIARKYEYALSQFLSRGNRMNRIILAGTLILLLAGCMYMNDPRP